MVTFRWYNMMDAAPSSYSAVFFIARDRVHVGYRDINDMMITMMPDYERGCVTGERIPVKDVSKWCFLSQAVVD